MFIITNYWRNVQNTYQIVPYSRFIEAVLAQIIIYTVWLFLRTLLLLLHYFFPVCYFFIAQLHIICCVQTDAINVDIIFCDQITPSTCSSQSSHGCVLFNIFEWERLSIRVPPSCCWTSVHYIPPEYIYCSTERVLPWSYQGYNGNNRSQTT